MENTNILDLVECQKIHKCAKKENRSCAICETGFKYIAKDPLTFECSHCICFECLEKDKSCILYCRHDYFQDNFSDSKIQKEIFDTKLKTLFNQLQSSIFRIHKILHRENQKFNSDIDNIERTLLEEMKKGIADLNKMKQFTDQVKQAIKQLKHCIQLQLPDYVSKTKINDDNIQLGVFNLIVDELHEYLNRESKLDLEKLYYYQSYAVFGLHQIQKYYDTEYVISIQKNYRKYGDEQFERVKFLVKDLSIIEADWHSYGQIMSIKEQEQISSKRRKIEDEPYNIEIMKHINPNSAFIEFFDKISSKKTPDIETKFNNAYEITLFNELELIFKRNNLSDEIISILTKTTVFYMFQFYDEVFIKDFKSQVAESFPLNITTLYNNISKDKPNFESFTRMLISMFLLPKNYLLDMNANEYFFYFFYFHKLFIFYISSCYESNDDVVNMLIKFNKNEYHLINKAFNERVCENITFVLIDTEERLQLNSNQELVDKITELKMSLIQMSIKSLGDRFKYWKNLLNHVECHLNNDKIENVIPIKINIQDEIKNIKSKFPIYSFCKFCKANIFRIRDKNPTQFYCYKHGVISANQLYSLCDFKIDIKINYPNFNDYSPKYDDTNLVLVRNWYIKYTMEIVSSAICNDKFFCFHAHSPQELEVWEFLKFYHVSLCDLCKFDENDCNDFNINRTFNVKEYILSMIANNNVDDFKIYFERFENLSHIKNELMTLGVEFSYFDLISEIFKVDNYNEFAKCLCQKLFPEVEYQFKYDQSDKELIQYIFNNLYSRRIYEKFFTKFEKKFHDHILNNRESEITRFYNHYKEYFYCSSDEDSDE